MLAIRAPRLFDGERFSSGGATVLTDAGRILAVEAGFPEVGPAWQVIEFDDATVLPGLIDTHVHLAADSGVGALDRIAGFTDDEMDAVITDGLRRHLANGVTTVRDLGDRRFGVLERRDRQRAGAATEPEPTILAAGPPLTSPGGHCAYMGGEVRGVPAMADAVRERIDRRVGRRQDHGQRRDEHRRHRCAAPAVLASRNSRRPPISRMVRVSRSACTRTRWPPSNWPWTLVRTASSTAAA